MLAEMDPNDVGALLSFLLILVPLWCVVAFIPYMIAKSRKHPRLRDIFTLTIVGLFVPFCWIAALIWAFSQPPPKTASKGSQHVADDDIPEAVVDEYKRIDCDMCYKRFKVKDTVAKGTKIRCPHCQTVTTVAV